MIIFRRTLDVEVSMPDQPDGTHPPLAKLPDHFEFIEEHLTRAEFGVRQGPVREPSWIA